MTSQFAAALATLLALMGGLFFFGSASDHQYDVVIVGTAQTGYSVTKNTALIEVDYDHRTTFKVTSTADVPRDFQINGLGTNGSCLIEFSPHDASYDCKSVKMTVTPGAAAVTLTAFGKNLLPWQYNNLGGGPYNAWAEQGAPGGALAPSDPELEIERDYSRIALLSLLLSLMSLGAGWWFRPRPTNR